LCTGCKRSLILSCIMHLYWGDCNCWHWQRSHLLLPVMLQSSIASVVSSRASEWVSEQVYTHTYVHIYTHTHPYTPTHTHAHRRFLCKSWRLFFSQKCGSVGNWVYVLEGMWLSCKRCHQGGYTYPLFYTLVAFLKNVGVNQEVVSQKWYSHQKIGVSITIHRHGALNPEVESTN
jgi:hypothetical protein